MVAKDNARYNLGCFATKEEAALAYDAAARTLHGEYARLNFPNENEQSTFHDVRKARPNTNEPSFVLRKQDGKRRPPSGYYGVYHRNSSGKQWVALLCAESKLKFIGNFHSREDAARAYDAAAFRAKGIKAKLNFPQEQHLDGTSDPCMP